jgi:hypothetical protein
MASRAGSRGTTVSSSLGVMPHVSQAVAMSVANSSGLLSTSS